MGELGESGQTLAFVGGNCSIQGFDHTGEDRFWTVSRPCIYAYVMLTVDTLYQDTTKKNFLKQDTLSVPKCRICVLQPLK